MKRRTGFIAAAIATIAIVAAGASLIFAAHENGEASNGGCDDFYWQSREPHENRANESSVITAADQANAQVVISQQIDIPCDGTQQITFNASASANAGTFLQTFIRITCLDGRCRDIGVAMPSDAQPFVLQQVCAPGDNHEPPANNRGMVVLGNATAFNDFRAGVTQLTFCGAEPPGRGQIASGTYLVEVLAYQTDNTGQAPGGGAGLDERALSIEMWGQTDCFEDGRARHDRDCGRRGHHRHER